MNNIITCKDLSKNFGKGHSLVEAVKAVDIEIETGSITGIVGESAAGKSTLLHMLGGLDRPSLGKVFFDNIDLYCAKDSARARIRNERIGFVYQFYNLLGDLNALENVMLPAMMRNMHSVKIIRFMAKELLSKMGLDKRLTHYPSQLSGGEAQRVAIARALINDPEVILCDEPTGNLDSKTSKQIYDIIYNINKEKGMTVVIVTHHSIEGYEFDKIFNMRDGQIV